MRAGAGRSRVIAVDWSGARSPGAQRRKIWLAAVAGGAVRELRGGFTRESVVSHLIAAARTDPRLVVGLDFAFSLPAWVLDRLGLGTAPDLWALAARAGERWLAGPEPPFWGRRRGDRPRDLPAAFRRTETRLAAFGPQSPLKVGGHGSVGTGSIRGMPWLRVLRDAGFSIWPFDLPGWPRVVEIYPRLFTPGVTKSRRAARARFLGAAHPGLPRAVRAAAVGSDDAFDALVSALGMAAGLDELEALPALTEPTLLREGAIWVPRSARQRLNARRGSPILDPRPVRPPPGPARTARERGAR